MVHNKQKFYEELAGQWHTDNGTLSTKPVVMAMNYHQDKHHVRTI